MTENVSVAAMIRRRVAVVFLAACWLGCVEPGLLPYADRNDASADADERGVVLDAYDVPTGDAALDASVVHEHGGDDAAADVSADMDDAPIVDSGPRAFRTLNGCDPMAAGTVDMTGTMNPTMLARLDFTFAPTCIRVRVGQSVIFRVESPADWRAHPLRAGEVVGGRVVDDPGSPIPYLNSGAADATVRFDSDGSYGFYCTRHYTLGFVGAVHVVPPRHT